MKIDTVLIQKLREVSGAGIMDAKNALLETAGDFDKALLALRKKGQTTAKKRADKEAKAGLVDVYTHMGRVAAMIEVNCETDFVARTPDFKKFVHDLAMQVAATNPQYLSPADVPKAVIDKEREVYGGDESLAGKPASVVAKIVDGKLEKFYQEVCLTSQPTIQDADITVEERMADLTSKLGEKIAIARFARFELGGK